MKNLRIWVPMLAALALAAPVRAEEIKVADKSSSAALIAQNTAPKPDAGTAPEQAPDAAQPAQTGAPGEHSEELPNAPEPVQLPPAASQQKPIGHGHPRVAGLKPRLGVVDPGTQVYPLTVHEKFMLFVKKTYPWQFLSAGISAGIGQARDSLPGYGQGAEGYGKRYGANFADASLSAFFSDFALPSMLHEDPRYYRMGAGNPSLQRVMHAVKAEFICHRDDGTMGFAFGKTGGKFIAPAIGNAYYPDRDRGVGITFERGALLLAGGMGHRVFDEFWPDIHAKIKKPKKVSQIPPGESTTTDESTTGGTSKAGSK